MDSITGCNTTAMTITKFSDYDCQTSVSSTSMTDALKEINPIVKMDMCLPDIHFLTGNTFQLKCADNTIPITENSFIS
jgi:hypothetical protein